MTEPRDFIIDTTDGQRSITIDPINITPSTGILYSTGQYDLKEGDVGIGTITFTSDKDWTFDGVGDINNESIRQIARFIMQIDRQPAGLTETANPNTISAPQEATQSFTIIITDKGQSVDVHIEMYNDVYSITIAGKSGIQLEQDHHGNWYSTKGQLDDALVQEIGRRITQHLME